MKITAIIGSPRGMRGNTGQLLGALLDAAREGGADATLLSLSEADVQPCRACDACHKVGECPVGDDFEAVHDAMQEADGLVLASPNYIFSVTAQMKALLDRCASPLHLQEFEGKYGAAVVTSGGAGSEEVERYLLRFLRALGCRTVGSVGAEAWKLADEAERPQVLEMAASLGRRLAQAIESRETFPEQEEERRAFFDRMKQLMALRKEDWPFEYNYWQRMGRF